MYFHLYVLANRHTRPWKPTLDDPPALYLGISSGANVFATLQIARLKQNANKLIVTVLPSSGERYLSSELYSNAHEETAAMSHTETLEENLKRLKLA
ncbi:hypothetical protein niasHT_008792 [Heterodera trifolii]|uniref:Cysteine synthase n=1 Tax=Heterodera trifolii TaxID=157864 RepID=A0ABD2M5R9_9BILA